MIPDNVEQNSFGKDSDKEANVWQSEIHELKKAIVALLSVEFLNVLCNMSSANTP